MSGETETIGAAVTAGLVASALERADAKGGPVNGACPNCGAQVSGNFCARCGQPTQLNRTVRHMAGEFLRNLFHLDTRAWRTLPLLLFRPGTLTNNYVHGKRARYISPLAMFLLSVFAMFVVFGGMLDGSRIGLDAPLSGADQVSERLADAEEELADANERLAELAAAGASGGEIEAAQLKANSAKLRAEALLDVSATLEEQGAVPADIKLGDAELRGDGSLYDEIRAATERGEIKFDTGWPTLDKRLRDNFLNPELAVYRIQNAAYENVFLLVPISLPLIWLLFIWRRGTTWFDHSVYILYSLSFVSLLFIAFGLLAMIPGVLGVLATPLLIASLVHSFFHLKGGYGLSWFSALWRLPFQLLFALVGLLIYIAIILVLGLAS